MTETGLFRVRFMDDILVLVSARWKLSGLVNQVLGSLLLETHPHKTFIGWTERGFDFPGYHPVASPSRRPPWPTSPAKCPGCMSKGGGMPLPARVHCHTNRPNH